VHLHRNGRSVQTLQAIEWRAGAGLASRQCTAARGQPAPAAKLLPSGRAHASLTHPAQFRTALTKYGGSASCERMLC
jgi:hypothetical protein